MPGKNGEENAEFSFHAVEKGEVCKKNNFFLNYFLQLQLMIADSTSAHPTSDSTEMFADTKNLYLMVHKLCKFNSFTGQ
jgi:hypothetical protein